jgi:hypothetical protein
VGRFLKAGADMEFVKLTDIFPVYGAGLVTGRDRFTIKETPLEIYNTLVEFAKMEDELARSLFKLGEDRSIELLSKLPCHVGREDPRYWEYLELIRFMQVPEIEQILLGKLLELKLVAKVEIKEFFAKKK